ncbi:MAG: DUF177 domain-containing protein [Oscillospiraceae bacterium]|nr:DUF177 domain-containing protein [Oscillospiraceae bacterium]
MKINTTPILNHTVTELAFSGSLPEDFPCGVTVTSSTVTGKIKNAAGYMTLTADISINYTQPCDRCLVDTEYSLEFALSAPVAVVGALEEDDDDYLFVKGDTLDITGRLAEEIYIHLPERHLCHEECRGLCQECGADMNKTDQAECGCTPKKIDAKWEKIKLMLDE